MGEFSNMEVLEALKFLEQGTDDPDDNEIVNRSIAEIEKLRADLASIRSVYDFAALEAKIAELRRQLAVSEEACARFVGMVEGLRAALASEQRAGGSNG